MILPILRRPLRFLHISADFGGLTVSETSGLSEYTKTDTKVVGPCSGKNCRRSNTLR